MEAIENASKEKDRWNEEEQEADKQEKLNMMFHVGHLWLRQLWQENEGKNRGATRYSKTPSGRQSIANVRIHMISSHQVQYI
jgi:hypothetical protein